MKPKYIECMCNDPDHLIRITSNDDPEDKEIYVCIHLYPFPWYKRIWTAIKYIFGKRSICGDYTEIVLDRESALTISEYIQMYFK